MIKTPAGFSFKRTVTSHGWYDLPPFELDPETYKLRYIFRDRKNGKLINAALNEENGKVIIKVNRSVSDKCSVEADARHILRLDEPFGVFYESLSGNDFFNWVSAKGAGRLLRSPTVYEDLVKTICTTNCSWGLTKNMVVNLVSLLGERSDSGKNAFPTAESMAEVKESFYRDEVRAGYRSPYLSELAEAVASGKVDPEKWLTSPLSTPELKKEIKDVKGIGDYAAENLLKLLGRYDGLALDSWLRSQFYKKHNKNKRCSDKKIAARYSKYGEWQGLVLWCDMTEGWHADEK